MKLIFILSNIFLFSIHMMPMETGPQPSSEVPTINKTVEAVKNEIEESAKEDAVSSVYIITVDDTADLDALMEKVQNDTGGKIIHVYRDSIRGFAIEVPPGTTEANFFYHDSIIDVEKDIIIKPLYNASPQEKNSLSAEPASSNPSISGQLLPPGINRVETDVSETANIDNVDDPLKVNIAIIDTGVDVDHPDLNVVYSRGFISGNSSGNDDHGHGTHVAGIAAARDNGIGSVGVAPGSRIYALKVLNSSGWGQLSDVIKAVDWVSKESKTSYTSKSKSSAKRNYDKYMKRYESYMKKYYRYMSRVDSYKEKAEEYKKRAEENKWTTEKSSDRDYRRYIKGYERYIKRYERYLEKSNRYLSRVQQYKERAEEYKRLAEEFLGSSDSRAERNYRRYMKRYESYMKKSNRYLSKVDRYKSRAEEYKSQADKYKSLAEQIDTSPKKVLSRTYKKYIKRYERYVEKSNRYLAKANDYKEKAGDYKKMAEQYLDESEDGGASNPNKIDVVNMSIGAIGVNRSLQRAIQACTKLGVVFVVSAGNGGSDIYGKDGVIYTSDDIIPAAYPEVVTVSAMADTDGQAGGKGRRGTYNIPDDTMPGFSNYSTKDDSSSNPVSSPGKGIDVAAPGLDVYSTWRGGGYRFLNGTSMSAPHVAGAFGLLIAKLGQDVNKDGRIDERDVAILRNLVVETAQPQSQWGPNNTGDRDPYHEGLLQVSSF